MTELSHLRRIRSFALRTGRMTEGQRQAYENNWQKYGLTIDAGRLDSVDCFGRAAPLVFEIGFGMGQSLAEMAQAEPGKDFIGVEVHTPGVGKLMMLCEQWQLSNVRIYEADAIDVIDQCLSPNSVDRFQLYFPDPWHKTKHHKRRIVQPEFLARVERLLKPGGILHFATDWQNYAEHMLQLLEASPGFNNADSGGAYSAKPSWRPETKFERRGQRLGHGVWDLIYNKNSEV